MVNQLSRHAYNKRICIHIFIVNEKWVTHKWSYNNPSDCLFSLLTLCWYDFDFYLQPVFLETVLDYTT